MEYPAFEIQFYPVELSIVLRDKYFKERGNGCESHKIIPYTIEQMEPYNPNEDPNLLLSCIFAMLNDSEHPRFDDSWKERSLSVGDIVIFPNGKAWEVKEIGFAEVSKW